MSVKAAMTVNEKLLIKAEKRQEIIQWLIKEKNFNPKAAPKCADNFFETMEFAGLMNEYGEKL